jgi:hypothetical protein
MLDIVESSGLFKSHSDPLARENSKHWWLLDVRTRVSVPFAKRPFDFYIIKPLSTVSPLNSKHVLIFYDPNPIVNFILTRTR